LSTFVVAACRPCDAAEVVGAACCLCDATAAPPRDVAVALEHASIGATLETVAAHGAMEVERLGHVGMLRGRPDCRASYADAVEIDLEIHDD